jgi:hypothetical protein
MKLETDTMGSIPDPAKEDIICVIKSSTQMPKGSIINLRKDDHHYLALRVGKRNGDHSITLKNKSLKVICSKKFNNNEAIKLFNCFLNEDFLWYEKYQWDQPAVNQLIENMALIRSMKAEENS